MRVAYLDCFAGIAGDMFLGALLDAGVPAEVLHNATAALNLGASLQIETVDRSGISCTKVNVLEHGELAEAGKLTHSHEHQHEPLEQDTPPLTHQLKTQHLHKTGHPHTHPHDGGHEHTHELHPHDHDHVHGRSLTQIRELIRAAPLADPIKQTSIKAFELLGHSEAKIHNVPVDQIHFHEVGAVDAIVDIVAVSAGIHHLQIGAWYSSALNVGGGTVNCAHGTFPVPAPATADLLRGVPTYAAHVQKELVTPTGAALIRALDPAFCQQPPMRVESIGYGAGTRNPKGFPNVLRLSIGELSQTTQGLPQTHATETVTVIEAALDDASPQLIAYVAEQALAQGALDVMLTPVLMKKGRPGTLITILSDPLTSASLQSLLLRESTTLGVRLRQEQRSCLQRTSVSVNTPYGAIRVKVGSEDNQERNAAPEYEDCRTAAVRYHVPLKQVQQAAIAAYVQAAPTNIQERRTNNRE